MKKNLAHAAIVGPKTSQQNARPCRMGQNARNPKPELNDVCIELKILISYFKDFQPHSCEANLVLILTCTTAVKPIPNPSRWDLPKSPCWDLPLLDKPILTVLSVQYPSHIQSPLYPDEIYIYIHIDRNLEIYRGTVCTYIDRQTASQTDRQTDR